MISDFLDSLGERLAKGEAEGKPWARVVIAILTHVFYATVVFVTIILALIYAFSQIQNPDLFTMILSSKIFWISVFIFSACGKYLWLIYQEWYDANWKNR